MTEHKTLDLDALAEIGFTPGPWRFDECGYKGKPYTLYAPYRDREFGSRGVVMAPRYKGIEAEELWIGISPENARLIAAAPELLQIARDKTREADEQRERAERAERLALSDDELGDLRRVYERLTEYRNSINDAIGDGEAVSMLGSEALDDEWDKLDCLIDRVDRARQALGGDDG